MGDTTHITFLTSFEYNKHNHFVSTSIPSPLGIASSGLMLYKVRKQRCSNGALDQFRGDLLSIDLESERAIHEVDHCLV